MSGIVEGWELDDAPHCSEAKRKNVRVLVERSWVTVEVDEKFAGTVSAQIPRAVFAELFRRVVQR